MMKVRAGMGQMALVVLLALAVASCNKSSQQGEGGPQGPIGGKADFISDDLLAPAPDDVFLIRNGDFSEGLDQWSRVPTSDNGTMGGPELADIVAFEMDEGGEATDCVQLKVGQKEAELTDMDGAIDYGSQQGAVLIQQFRVDVAGTYLVSAKLAAVYKGLKPSDRNGYGGRFTMQLRAEQGEVSEAMDVSEEIESESTETEPAIETESESTETEPAIETEPESTETETETEPESTETEPAIETDPESTEADLAIEADPESTETDPESTETEPESTETEPVSTETEPVSEAAGEQEPVVIASHDFQIIASGETKRHTMRGEVDLKPGVYRFELIITRQAKSTQRTPTQFVDQIKIVPLDEIEAEPEEEPEEVPEEELWVP